MSPYRTLAALALAALVLLAGCGDSHVYWAWDDDFYLHHDYDGYTGTQTYSFETYEHEATVVFEAWDFDSGTFEVEIRDDHERLIYSRTFSGSGHEYHVDETSEGDGGRWHVVVTGLDLRADVSLRVY